METVNAPGICVGVAVAEVVHVHAILLQAAGALLDARQEASPVAPPLSFPVQPPGHRTAVCNTVEHLVMSSQLVVISMMEASVANFQEARIDDFVVSGGNSLALPEKRRSIRVFVYLLT